MSFIFGNAYTASSYPNNNNPNATSVTNRNNLDGSTGGNNSQYSVSAQNLVLKLKSLQCLKDAGHGGFDFICVSAHCPFERLVCIDCFKDYPEKMKYMQMNGRDFLRIQKFIDEVTSPELEATDFEKIQKIQSIEAKLERVLGQYDKQMLEEEKKIRQFYKDVEIALIEVIKQCISQNLESQLENYRANSARTREKITSILKTCGFLGNFDGSGKSGQGRNSHL